LLIAAVLLASSLQAATPPLAPEEQKNRFHLPPGFEIDLVLSEPLIGQPMNLNFDARGRLWVTSSVEYPYPAESPGVQPRPDRFATNEKHPPRDWVIVVEETNATGKATKVSRYCEGLNIPIGITPLGEGDEAIVYSIPSIDRFRDTTASGKANQREKLYGEIGNIDTHGMANSFTPWIDGWIYGCHGFSNSSEITDSQGNVTRMRSGNTYRFRRDGSHFQQFTHGQVNPFGMTFDPLGNLFNADCHTMPLTLLLRGALYPHFGSQPDRLGFGPNMIDHNHGSTGICGPAYYAADHFPAAFHDNIFLCNPVTQRIHRDRLKSHGSTYQVETLPDLVTCDDPWFRPVDVIVGPDGALYIADFYNPVIGHYEAPLNHPDRDRTHGRVWRVTYRGDDPTATAFRPAVDLTDGLTAQELVGKLDSPNLLVRVQTTNLIVEKYSPVFADLVRPLLEKGSSFETVHAMWIVERTDGLDDEMVARLADSDSRMVRVHLAKLLAERPDWSNEEYALADRFLEDEDGFVRRAAADALGRHPRANNIPTLLATLKKTRPEDTHLIHTIRMAVREHFRDAATGQALVDHKFDESTKDSLAKLAAVSETSVAATWLVMNANAGTVSSDTLESIVDQIATSNDRVLIDRYLALAQDEERSTIEQLQVLLKLSTAYARAGNKPKDVPALNAWAELLGQSYFAKLPQPKDWTDLSLSPSGNPVPFWGFRQRETAKGKRLQFVDTIVHGENRTGILRSRPFDLPEAFEFWLCGHDGPPGKPAKQSNRVEIRLAAEDDLVAVAAPPRNDVAQRIRLDLTEFAGKRGYLQIVDGDSAVAYAWLAIADIQPSTVPLPDGRPVPSPYEILRLAREFGRQEALPKILETVANAELPADLRVEAARLAFDWGKANQVGDHLTSILDDPRTQRSAKTAAIRLLGRSKDESVREALVLRLPQSDAPSQREIAAALVRDQSGAARLLQAIEQGKASAYVLQDAEVIRLLGSLEDKALQTQAGKLTADLPPKSDQVQQRISQLAEQFQPGQHSADVGQKVFEKHCAACHKIGSKGSLIGPQLDGVGKRPIGRLVEDILDPSRNVDAAFRTVLIQTVDGQVISGLPRREEGALQVVANNEGKEIRIAKDDIVLQKSSPLSLMPANFNEQLKAGEMFALLKYLQKQRTEVKK